MCLLWLRTIACADNGRYFIMWRTGARSVGPVSCCIVSALTTARLCPPGTSRNVASNCLGSLSIASLNLVSLSSLRLRLSLCTFPFPFTAYFSSHYFSSSSSPPSPALAYSGAHIARKAVISWLTEPTTCAHTRRWWSAASWLIGSWTRCFLRFLLPLFPPSPLPSSPLRN